MCPHLTGFTTVRHEAMGTAFWITIDHEDQRYARAAAAEAFYELDRIDSHLSRFIENSDVARLNRLEPGRSLMVSPCTFECLEIALRLEQRTQGAFNVAYASQPRRRAVQAIALAPRPPIVQVVGTGMELDLGGIGKGFALDRLATLLDDWDVRRVLLRASASTLLACQPPRRSSGWPCRFGPLGRQQRRHLSQSALSGSGIDVKGEHIIDPHTGCPAKRRRLVWAGAKTATVADALSTSFMIMTDQQIRDLCQGDPSVVAFTMTTDGTSVRQL